MILLDTHVLLWSSLDETMLGRHSRERLSASSESASLYISPISAWEIAMLVEKDRLVLPMPTLDWIVEVVKARKLQWAALTAEIAAAVGQLPHGIHGDPADRIIVATARHWNCSLVTVDRKILDYAKAGHVQAIDAGR